MRATFSPDGLQDNTARMSSSQNHTLRAGLYMVITTACFVAGDTCIKLIGTSLPLGQVICLIGLVSSLFLLIVCGQQCILKNLPMPFYFGLAQLEYPKLDLVDLLDAPRRQLWNQEKKKQKKNVVENLHVDAKAVVVNPVVERKLLLFCCFSLLEALLVT